ncbi:hypothetical protein [Haloarchaeobius sp. HRN-SO-5]|uniref:hypothetical protein n=1 Tax=Haloarchaeobius sp. HRN-SO-5 TaxID=3446118 RepID=UPI003EC09487
MSDEAPVVREQAADDVVTRERADDVAVAGSSDEDLDHEDFDPVGTLALIAVYFLILVGMWVFVYFVEFLGNGPTVVG